MNSVQFTDYLRPIIEFEGLYYFRGFRIEMGCRKFWSKLDLKRDVFGSQNLVGGFKCYGRIVL